MPNSPPADRKYLASHEWHKPEANLVVIGVTQIAADELTDVTYVSLPKVGDKIAANGRFGEIESVKATSDLLSGISGTVAEVNPALAKDPSLVNTDPYEAAWMIKLKPDNLADLDKLLDVKDYLAKTGH
jgi:glycine cleavage system H protein